MTQLTLDTDLTQYQREMLNIVHNLANSLLTIIDDILDLSKIEAGRIAAQHFLRRQGKIVIRIFPDKSITKKPAETRMGKGKGSVDYWACKVKPGRVMFELDGVNEEIAREALRLAAMKLPIKTRVVVREDW